MIIIRYIRAGIRLLLLFSVSLVDLAIVLFCVSILKKDVVWGMRYRKEVWAKQMMWIGGIKLRTSGKIPKGPHLVVVNHRSSIDPLINLADILCYPIAKIEFKSWPIIGPGSNSTGIVFVDRSSKKSRHMTRLAIADALKSGMNVLIYPEGGTHDGDLTRLFKKGSFEVAAEYDYPVLPVAMEYKDRADNWDHSENFVAHFFKRFGKARTHIEIRYGQPLKSGNSWTLMRQTQSWINDQIIDMRQSWDGPNWYKNPLPQKQTDSMNEVRIN